MAKRGLLATSIPSTELDQALNQAALLMQPLKRRILSAEMLLYACLKLPDTDAHRILHQLAEQRGFNWAKFERDVQRAAEDRLVADVNFDFETHAGRKMPLGDDILYVIDEGLTLAKSRDETRCGTAHTLVYLTHQRVTAGRILLNYGITEQAVRDLLPDPQLSSNRTITDYIALARNHKLPPVHRRDLLLNELISTVSMSHNPNVILVGPTGVGKRSLVYALAAQIAAGQGPAQIKSVIEMDEQALLTAPKATVRAAVRNANNGILFVPNINRFFGGFRADFREDVCNILQQAFFDTQVIVVGTTTTGAFADRLKGSSIIAQTTKTLAVQPASVTETEAILNVQKSKFEVDYRLKIELDAIAEVARLAGRYMTEDPLPGAAVHLLHRTCVQHNLDEQQSPVTVMTVRQAVSLLTGIPVSNMDADERKRLATMDEALRRRIIGQNEAVSTVSRAVKSARVGLKDPKRPIGSFLFLGPTGVGKSELAKALAEFMFGTEDALIVFDMSEYMDDSSVNRLIGPPPGYVGSEAGGQLTNAVMSHPYSVVLFDEVEKADVKVFDLLLQIMDEGRLTSGRGERVKFSECVILMTSNLGGKALADLSLTAEKRQGFAKAALEDHFRPEFLNRLDDIVFFDPLDNISLGKILDLMLRKEFKMLAAQDLDLQVTPQAKVWLLARNDRPEWGARPLRRLIRVHIRNPLADYLLTENPPSGAKILVDVTTADSLQLKTVQ